MPLLPEGGRETDCQRHVSLTVLLSAPWRGLSTGTMPSAGSWAALVRHGVKVFGHASVSGFTRDTGRLIAW